MKLSIVEGSYSVCKMHPASALPECIFSSKFYSVTKTPQELSLVCESGLFASVTGSSSKSSDNGTTVVEDGWGLIKVEGPLDFSLTGILASIATPLAENKVSIFAISTFDTDYLLVKLEKLSEAKAILAASGFEWQ